MVPRVYHKASGTGFGEQEGERLALLQGLSFWSCHDLTSLDKGLYKLEGEINPFLRRLLLASLFITVIRRQNRT